LLLRELEREPRVATANGAFMQAVCDDFLPDAGGDGARRAFAPAELNSSIRTELVPAGPVAVLGRQVEPDPTL
jgi:hypothetical protein